MADPEKEYMLDKDKAALLEHENEFTDEDDRSANKYESFTDKKKKYPKAPKLAGKAWGRVWCKVCQLPFPVFFIIWNEFCERFSYYGMRAVLTLFLKTFLNFEDDTATAIYHSFIVLCYMLPLVGAIISDSCLGKYGTIVSLSIFYCIGNILMAISAIPFNDSRGANIGLSALALIIIAFGTGGIKPCVSAFGGDQFTEAKVHLLPIFFSVFYFSINAGSVLSTILTPILRGYVSCFGLDECFPLAFGVPAILMLVATGIFLFGTRWYVIAKPQREAALLFFRVPASIFYAIYRRIRLGNVPGTRNFMDYASPRFSDLFVYEVWLLLRVLVMFLPLPIFWALFDQQGSRWTLQALRMDGRLGKFVILPDQIQALNPIFIIVLIPIFESVIYPILGRVHLLKKPLQRMATGMAVAGVAFVLAGFLELYIQSQSGNLKGGQARVVISNALNVPVSLQYGSQIHNLSRAETLSPIIENNLGLKNLTVMLQGVQVSSTFQFNVREGHIIQVFIARDNDDQDIILKINDTIEWFPDGDKSSVTVFLGNIESLFSSNVNFSLCLSGKCPNDKELFANNLTSNDFSISQNISIGSYEYIIESDTHSLAGSLPQRLEPGGIYTIVITLNGSNNAQGVDVDVAAANSPNSVSIFLQIPMYFVITFGEVLFSITGLEFAYSQAPVSMKSLCSAAWLLTVAFGNLVVVIIAESSAFSNQAHEFFFFAAAIEACFILFAVMAYFYKYVDPATLLVSSQPSGGDNRPNGETSKLVPEDPNLRDQPSYDNQMNEYEPGQQSPSPAPRQPTLPQPSDYESEF